MEFLEKEAFATVEEIRDVNAKTIGIAKLFGWLVIAFLGYVTVGLSYFAGKGVSMEAGILLEPTKAFLLAAKIYGLVGIALASSLLGAFFYLLGQWAVSKKHRMRSWKHVAQIRGYLMRAGTLHEEFLRNWSLLPADDNRPHVSWNTKLFGFVVNGLAFLSYAGLTVYFSMAFSLELILRHHLSGFAGTSAPAVFWQFMAPATAFVLVAWGACLRFATNFLLVLILAEGTSSGVPFPSFPPKLEMWSRRWGRASFVIVAFGFVPLLVLGAQAIPGGSGDSGHTLHYLSLGYTIDYPIVYWVFGALSAISLFCHLMRVIPIVRLIPKSGAARIEAVRFMVELAKTEKEEAHRWWQDHQRAGCMRKICERFGTRRCNGSDHK